MLRCFVGKNICAWDNVLCQEEFSHNHAFNRIVYGLVPCSPIDLGVVPDAERDHGKAIESVANVSYIHQVVHDNLKLTSAKYKEMAYRHRRDVQFSVGDKVWTIITKECFLPHEYNKLKDRKIGPLEIVEKINAMHIDSCCLTMCIVPAFLTSSTWFLTLLLNRN